MQKEISRTVLDNHDSSLKALVRKKQRSVDVRSAKSECQHEGVNGLTGHVPFVVGL